ncbi:MAG: sel1 repeat family protein [Alphaproteobacteria bacterium]|nr:MAG: sel1 repeat family protein [Alphaproteobacteria bacterium]
MGHEDRKFPARLRRYLAAAENGKAEAFYHLGLYYASGHGVDPDYVAAHKWFNLAAVRGVKEAVAERAELAREMSPADIAAAQREAREWLQAHAA